MTSNAPPMVSRLEDSITAAFYGRDAADARARCYSVGLQSPLWLWTHEENFLHTADGKQPPLPEAKDVKKACRLVEWLLRNQVDLSNVVVLTPLAMKAELRLEMIHCLERWAAAQAGGDGATTTPGNLPRTPGLPVVLGHHELPALNARDKTSYTYDVVIYVFGLPPDDAAVAQAVGQSDYISTALGAARKAFVMIIDSGWGASHFTAKWPQWKHFIGKLQDEQPPVSFAAATTGGSTTPSDARLPRLMGSSLPLCCGRHPNQRQLEYGTSSILAVCEHLCLRHYDCGVAHHICRDGCHPHRHHASCPCACTRAMACGHTCLLPCSSRCNCFEVVERALSCSHQVVLGLDPESLEPIYGTVNHVFRGVCADDDLPCAVEFTTDCARCLGPLRTRCFEAQQAGHSIAFRTLVCDACRRAERELRAQILGEVLTGAEAEKRKLKVELQRTLYQQRKAASQGLFTPGVKVEITDASKCVPPLLAEDDFPGIAFVDMDTPSFYRQMEGAYGTVVSSHVDVMDRAEVRNLVRLPDGQHVLVTDGGLRMIRALTTGVMEKRGAALMLTFHDKPKATTDSSGNGDAAGSAAEFDAARALLGTLCYLGEPVPYTGARTGTITDKVVTVAAIDPMSASNVVVECCIVRRRPDSDEGGEDAAEERSAALAEVVMVKRPRLEEDLGTPGDDNCEPAVLRFTAPITALEPLKGYQPGQYVYVLSPQRQVRDPRTLADFACALRGWTRTAGTTATTATRGPLTCVPVSPDAAYELVALVNPPLWEDSDSSSGSMGAGGQETGEVGSDAETAGGTARCRIGPCAILRPRSTASIVTATRPSRRASGRNGGRPAITTTSANVRTATVAPLVAVPFLFTAPDELAEAEGQLDEAAQRQFEQRLRDAIAIRSDEIAVRNDEEAFHAQQQMGTVTAELREAVRTAFSVPVPLPSPEQVAAARRRHLQLPAATAVTARVAGAKDALVAKRELAALPAWLEEMQARFQRDAEAAEAHVRVVQARVQQHQQQLRARATALQSSRPPYPAQPHYRQHSRPY